LTLRFYHKPTTFVNAKIGYLSICNYYITFLKKIQEKIEVLIEKCFLEEVLEAFVGEQFW